MDRSFIAKMEAFQELNLLLTELYTEGDLKWKQHESLEKCLRLVKSIMLEEGLK